MGIRARLEAAMPTRRVGLAALMIGATAVGYEYYRYREWNRRTSDMFRKTMAIANGDDGDEASKQTVAAELEKWLTSMQAGETGEDFWSGTNYSRLFSVRSGTILKVSTRALI